MEVADLSGSHRNRADVHDFLFELVSERCSSEATTSNISQELNLQHTLNKWNRYTHKHLMRIICIIQYTGTEKTLCVCVAEYCWFSQQCYSSK